MFSFDKMYHILIAVIHTCRGFVSLIISSFVFKTISIDEYYMYCRKFQNTQIIISIFFLAYWVFYSIK